MFAGLDGRILRVDHQSLDANRLSKSLPGHPTEVRDRGDDLCNDTVRIDIRAERLWAKHQRYADIVGLAAL